MIVPHHQRASTILGVDPCGVTDIRPEMDSNSYLPVTFTNIKNAAVL